jgi:thiol-disulfide isomerase/thioredoxin
MLTAALACAGAVSAGDETPAALKLGDPAPPIEIAHWIKGEPVQRFEPGKVYVVEFWATWCGPCRDSMPHLSELQQQYQGYGVSFIGISDEPLDTVTQFLAKTDAAGKTWSDKARYTLTTDPDKSCYNAYMKGAGRSGIPTAFVIGKDGMLEWIDHPMNLDWVVDSIARDSWDRSKAKEISALYDEFQGLGRAGTPEQQVAVMDRIAALEPKALGPLRFRQFAILLSPLNQPEKAYQVAEDLLKENWNNASMLNYIAWFIADEPGVKSRDFKLAERAASRADSLTGGKDFAIIDTLARIRFEQGDVKKAIELQRKAIELASDDRSKEMLRKTLQAYEAGKSPRDMPME